MANPILYNVVDFLYKGVMNHDFVPRALKDRDMASAFVLGSAGTYAVITALQWTSRNLMGKIIPNFDEKWLPTLEKICIAGMAAAPLIYAAVNPEGAREIMTLHPTYTSGMAGVYVSSIAAAGNDLRNRSKYSS